MDQFIQHLRQLTNNFNQLVGQFNAFVQKTGADVQKTNQMLAQVVAGHNQLDKAMEQLARQVQAHHAAIQQVMNVVAASSGGAVSVAQAAPAVVPQVNGAPAVVPVAPGQTTIDMPPIVSATGAEMTDPTKMSPQDQALFFSGGD